MYCVKAILVVVLSCLLFRSYVTGYGLVGQGIKLASSIVNDGLKFVTNTVDNIGHTVVDGIINNVLPTGTKTPSQTQGYEYNNHQPSQSKSTWIHRQCERRESMFLKTSSGKTLHCGEMNALQNAIQLKDLMSNFHIKFPSAKPDSKYTMVKYSHGSLVKAIFNIKGQDLLNGISQDKIGNILAGAYRNEIIKNIAGGNMRYCIEILEQNPVKQFTRLPFVKNKWESPLHDWAEDLNCVVAKTCFLVMPSDVTDIHKLFPGGELDLFFSTYAKQIDTFIESSRNVKRPGNQTPNDNYKQFVFIP